MTHLPALLSLLLLTAATCRATTRYIDTADSTGIELHGLTSAPVPTIFHIDTEATEATIAALVTNHRASPSATGRYTDPSGHRHTVLRPGLQFVAINTRGDTLRFNISSTPLHSELASAESFTISATLGATEILTPIRVEAPESPFHSGQPATLVLTLSPTEATLTEEDDHTAVIWQSTDSLIPFPVTGIGFAPMPGAHLTLHRAAATTPRPLPSDFAPLDDTSHLASRFATTADPLEGFWALLDYSTDDTRLLKGGDYTFALLTYPGGYRLIYIDGATRNSSRWRPGAVKALLKARRMPGAYSAVWLDAEGISLDPDCAVQVDSPRLLTVQFPHTPATLRLHKIAAP